MNTTGHSHEVYVAKYAQWVGGEKSQYFLSAPPTVAGVTGRMDFYVWLVRTPEADIVVDAGFTSDSYRRFAAGLAASADVPGGPQFDHYREPSAALRMLGVDVGKVPYVIISHLHFDHVGDLEPFTGAKFVLQEREMAFWTGPMASRSIFRTFVDASDVTRVVDHAIGGRVQFVDGDVEIVPGVKVHLLGGHTPGLQAVSVETTKGTVVLASDAAHLQDHVDHDSPCSLVTNVPDMLKAFDRIRELASSPELIIPGHEPTVMDKFDAVPGLEGIAVKVA